MDLVGELLLSGTTGPDPTISFDPVRTRCRAWLYDWVKRLREPAYPYCSTDPSRRPYARAMSEEFTIPGAHARDLGRLRRAGRAAQRDLRRLLVHYSTLTAPSGRQGDEGNRAFKQRLVEEGQAHAALVFDGDRAVAWCEYGTPEELPNIHHRKEYDADRATDCPTTGSPASSSTSDTGARASPRSPCAARST